MKKWHQPKLEPLRTPYTAADEEPLAELGGLVGGYKAVQLLVGLVAFFFGPVLIVGYWFTGGSGVGGSMSSYYNSDLRDVFVGMLFALAFLFSTYHFRAVVWREPGLPALGRGQETRRELPVGQLARQSRRRGRGAPRALSDGQQSRGLQGRRSPGVAQRLRDDHVRRARAVRGLAVPEVRRRSQDPAEGDPQPRLPRLRGGDGARPPAVLTRASVGPAIRGRSGGRGRRADGVFDLVALEIRLPAVLPRPAEGSTSQQLARSGR